MSIEGKPQGDIPLGFFIDSHFYVSAFYCISFGLSRPAFED
jgi:hypothetical protein